MVVPSSNLDWCRIYITKDNYRSQVLSQLDSKITLNRHHRSLWKQNISKWNKNGLPPRINEGKAEFWNEGDKTDWIAWPKPYHTHQPLQIWRTQDGNKRTVFMTQRNTEGTQIEMRDLRKQRSVCRANRGK